MFTAEWLREDDKMIWPRYASLTLFLTHSLSLSFSVHFHFCIALFSQKKKKKRKRKGMARDIIDRLF